MTDQSKDRAASSGSARRANLRARLQPEPLSQGRGLNLLRFRTAAHPRVESERKKLLRVFKFGGTSVNGAARVRNVAAIIAEASSESSVAAVVSAMAGVTDQLLRAARAAEMGNRQLARENLDEVESKHVGTAAALIQSTDLRVRVTGHFRALFEACAQVCDDVVLSGQLLPWQRDLLGGLGERLSAPLVAAALLERGTPSEPVEATTLIVTDANHGAAEPVMNLTREQCMARLKPLLNRSIVPVITGFIGATPERVLTTLGRGGSDFSATIIAAGIDADEVVIWSDVDGLMTADPRIVVGARLVTEISYQEASELAFFGAKVLHPRTLDAMNQHELPIWIRNTLAPESKGTRITPNGPKPRPGMKALASTDNVALVRFDGPGIGKSQEFVSRAAGICRVHDASLLFGSSPSPNRMDMVVRSPFAQPFGEMFRTEFAHELSSGSLKDIQIQSGLGLLTAVGTDASEMAECAIRTLRDSGIEVITSTVSETGCRFSLLVDAKDLTCAAVALHRELVLNRPAPESVESRLRFRELEAFGAD